MARLTPREPEGDWRGFDAYDVIDSTSASFELERLLDGASKGCPDAVADLDALLEAAHDDLEAGRIAEGVRGLWEFGHRVEALREGDRIPAGLAGDLLALTAAAIEWAEDEGDPDLWFDDSAGGLGE